MKLRLITSSGKIITLKPVSVVRTYNSIILNFNEHKKLILRAEVPNEYNVHQRYAVQGKFSSPDFKFLHGEIVFLSLPNNNSFKNSKPSKIWYQNNPLT